MEGQGDILELGQLQELSTESHCFRSVLSKVDTAGTYWVVTLGGFLEPML